ncbi:hypothetical protein SDC9_147304 [bioreactor metagenome]|uniref:Uncharacterized protein n=1 Tax=bioreactor metagenome TaxID=1076179 RepID=A0A645EFI5_9ZZZZ
MLFNKQVAHQPAHQIEHDHCQQRKAHGKHDGFVGQVLGKMRGVKLVYPLVRYNEQQRGKHGGDQIGRPTGSKAAQLHKAFFVQRIIEAQRVDPARKRVVGQ